MNKEYITTALYEWMESFLEKPNSLLDNWSPCPYARKARLDKKIYIDFEVPNIYKIVSLLDTYDVLVICYDHTKITASQFNSYAKNLNTELLPKNYVVLEDHPDAVEIINGVTMNFGECALLLIQKRDALKIASDQLKSTGYYKLWTKQDLNEVVNWR